MQRDRTRKLEKRIGIRTLLRSVLFLVLVLIACGTETYDRSPAGPAGDGTLSVETIPPQRIIQGDPVRFTFRITNRTAKPVVLLELTPSSSRLPTSSGSGIEGSLLQEGASKYWTHRIPGSVEYNDAEQEFTFQPEAGVTAGSTDRVFYSGLLLPGQKTNVRLRAIYQNTGEVDQNFVLRYFHPEPDRLRERIFVPDRKISSEDSSPVTFSRSGENQQLSELGRKTYFMLHPLFQVTEEKFVSRTVRVHPRSFSMRTALKTLQEKTGGESLFRDIRFAPWLDNSWVVQMQDGTLWTVSERGARRLEGLSFSQLKGLNADSGPFRFYVTKNVLDRTSFIDALARVSGQSGAVLKKQHGWTVPRKKAAEQIPELTRNGFQLKWIREPLTNRLVLLARSP